MKFFVYADRLKYFSFGKIILFFFVLFDFVVEKQQNKKLIASR